MGPFFKKDFLLLWRDRNETFISLISMLVLIIVLSYTTSSWIEKPTETLQMTVAVVNEDNEAAGLAQFQNSLASRALPANSAAALKTLAEQMLPTRSLLQTLGEQPFVKTDLLDGETARQRLHDAEAEAVITIPAGFTQAALNKMLLNEGSGSAVTLTADRHASLRVDVLQDMLDSFVQSLNLQTAMGHALGAAQTNSFGFAPANQPSPVGGREMVAGVKMLTSFQYYSIAIGIITMLFLASASALKAIREKREHVFQRILLTGSHPLRYLAGKAGSTFCMSFLQLTCLIVVSHLMFNLFPGRSMQFWFGMVLIIIMFSLIVAAFSVLFTSIVFRVKDSAASGLFSLVIGLLGMIGGSFLPIYLLPDWLKQVGEWTPNGLSLSVFIQWIQQDSFAILTTPFLKLTIFSIVIIGLGSLLFPRRGRI